MLRRLFFNKLLVFFFFVKAFFYCSLFSCAQGWEYFTSENSILGDNRINVVVVNGGVKWVGTAWGLYSFDDETWIDYSAFLPHPQVRSIAFDNNNSLWVGTLGGLVNYTGDNWIVYDNQNSIINNQVNAVCFDNNNSVYVGTIDGLFVLDDDGWELLVESSFFEPFIHVSSLSFSGDSLCIGTKNGGFGYFYNKQVLWESVSSGLIDNSIEDFVVDENNNSWVATPFGGLAVHTPGGSWITYNSSFYSSWPSNTLLSIFQDNNGIFWIGTNEAGLFSFSLVSGIPYTEVYDSFNSGLLNDIVLDITQDDNGVFWIGTDGGLVRWEGPQNQTSSFLNKPNVFSFPSSSDLYLYSIDGRLLSKENDFINLNLSSFSSGVYLLKVNGFFYKIIIN